MRTAYKAKTITGAQRRVRELQKQNDDLNELASRLMNERVALAKLAADGPAFFNPLEVMNAKRIRDGILARNGFGPDGKPFRNT